MSKKNRKIAKYSLPLYTNVDNRRGVETPFVVNREPTFCGQPLKAKNVNQLWNWKTLEDVKF